MMQTILCAKQITWLRFVEMYGISKIDKWSVFSIVPHKIVLQIEVHFVHISIPAKLKILR